MRRSELVFQNTNNIQIPRVLKEIIFSDVFKSDVYSLQVQYIMNKNLQGRISKNKIEMVPLPFFHNGSR